MWGELERRLNAAERRWLLWNLLRASTASLGVWAAIIYLNASSLWHGLSLACFVMAWFLRPTQPELPALIDEAGHLDGLCECAFDNRHRDNPTAEAQRQRALKAMQNLPLSTYVPVPSAGWAVPVFLWVLTVILIPRNEAWVVPTDAGPSVGATADSESAAPEARPGPSEGQRPVVTGARSTQKASSQAEKAPPSGGIGRKTGKTSGGDSGRRQVPRYVNADGSIQWAEKSAVRTRSSQMSEDAIAEPARPFPPKYQSVIADWFNRRVK